jgi:hypothetical protein
MRHVLSLFDYAGKDSQIVGTPDRRIVVHPDEVR